MSSKIDEALKQYFPTATDEEVDGLMWCATCFPFGDEDQIVENIKEKGIQSNSNIDLAINIAHEEIKKGMKEIHIEEMMETINPS